MVEMVYLHIRYADFHNGDARGFKLKCCLRRYLNPAIPSLFIFRVLIENDRRAAGIGRKRRMLREFSHVCRRTMISFPPRDDRRIRRCEKLRGLKSNRLQFICKVQGLCGISTRRIVAAISGSRYPRELRRRVYRGAISAR